MRILVIGGGGREHALAWALTTKRSDVSVVCAPGNPGIAAVARCLPADASPAAGPPPGAAPPHREPAGGPACRRGTRTRGPDGGGPRAAVERGCRGCVCRGAPSHRRSYPRGGGARIEQGVCEALHGAPPRADRPLCRL